MKTVFLLRHAKSSWDQPGLSDSLRPLAPRGRKAAPRIGAYMARNDLIPDRVLCSHARRARETWDMVSERLGDIPKVEITEELYHTNAYSLLALLRELPDDESAVLLVGHNPTFEDLALDLAGSGEEEAMAQLQSKYPTGTLAVLDFSTSTWKEISEGGGYLRAFIRPRALPGETKPVARS